MPRRALPVPAGATRWPVAEVPRGFRLSERSCTVPPVAREAVAALVSSWEFKRRAGFQVPAGAVAVGARETIVARVFGMRFREPVRVVWADAAGFGYQACPGHPVIGEESFLLTPDGVFVARSLSRPAHAGWWMVAPVLWTLQWRTHRSYTRIVRAEVARVVGRAVRGEVAR